MTTDDRANCATLLTYGGHTGDVWALAWSPDGTRIASGGDDNTVQVWEADSGRRLLTYTDHSGPIQALAWSPDATRVVSAARDATVQIWEAATGRLVLTRPCAGTAREVAWSPDGLHVSARIEESVGSPQLEFHWALEVWEATGAQTTLRWEDTGDFLDTITWSPDGQQLATGSSKRGVRMWDIASGAMRFMSERPHITAAAWLPDGQHMAALYRDHPDRRAVVWAIATGETVSSFELGWSAATPILWSPDGTLIASADGGSSKWYEPGSSEVAINDGNSGKYIATYRGHPTIVQVHSEVDGDVHRSVRVIAWAPDSRRLASALDASVHVWQITR